MKSFVRLAAVAAALAVAVPASAQQRAQPKIGLGVAITPVDGIPSSFGFPVEIYVPIALSREFRIEPSIGFVTQDDVGSAITLGIGGFFVNQVAPQVDVYAGGRLKLNRVSSDVADDSDMDFILAAAAGGEYFFVPKFSVGLEAQVGLYQLGDFNGDTDGFFTNGLAFLRVYF